MNFFETPICDLMSRNISTIEAHMNTHEALERMRKLKVSHLPVKVGGKTVGILSERDLSLFAAIEDTNPNHIPAYDVMISDPLTMNENTPLNKVAREMLENNTSCVLLTNKKEELVGIFTTHDVLRILSES